MSNAILRRATGGVFRAMDGSNEAEIALWAFGSPRYFAVDYDGGVDTNKGWSDTSMAEAGTVAVKTLERLAEILPAEGNRRTAVVAIKARAAGAVYRNIADTADAELQLVGFSGYQTLIIRGTGDVPTAGAVAFANDAADKVALGAQIFAGTNAAGYNPVAPISAATFDVQLAGGGAPGLAAEPTLIGKRIRFDSATTTVALQNVCRMIHANDTDTITVEANLPATPVAADVFYIEEPAVSLGRIQIHNCGSASQAQLPSFAFNGLTIAGFRMPTTTAGFVAWVARSIAGGFQVAFCDIYSPGFSGVTWGQITAPTISAFYTDESNTSIRPGVGLAVNGWMGTVTNCNSFVMNSSASRLGRMQILNIGGGAFSVGNQGGCYFGVGLLFQNCKGSGGTQNTVGGSVLGNNASSTIQRTRMTTGFAGACLSMTNTDAFLRGLSFENVGALSIMEVRGLGSNVVINDVVGSTGNTGPGLDLSLNRDCNILMGQLNANTFTGAAGQDIRGAGLTFYTHADVARTDVRDAFGNHVQGPTSTNIGSSALVTNDASAAIGQYQIVRATASGVVRLAQANTAANAAGLVGVTQSSNTTGGTTNKSMAVNAGGTWIQFDAAPTAGAIAYLSTATAGNAQVAIPAVAGTNQKLRLGRVLSVSGTLGYVAYTPEILAVLADGAA